MRWLWQPWSLPWSTCRLKTKKTRSDDIKLAEMKGKKPSGQGRHSPHQSACSARAGRAIASASCISVSSSVASCSAVHACEAREVMKWAARNEGGWVGRAQRPTPLFDLLHTYFSYKQRPNVDAWRRYIKVLGQGHGGASQERL